MYRRDAPLTRRTSAPQIDFIRKVMGPYLLLRFLVMPSPLLLASLAGLPGAAFYWAAVGNLALSDMLSNIHSFIIIATKCASVGSERQCSHAGRGEWREH